MAPLGHLCPEEGHHLLHVAHLQQARLAALQDAHHHLQDGRTSSHQAVNDPSIHSLPVCCQKRLPRSPLSTVDRKARSVKHIAAR